MSWAGAIPTDGSVIAGLAPRAAVDHDLAVLLAGKHHISALNLIAAGLLGQLQTEGADIPR